MVNWNCRKTVQTGMNCHLVVVFQWVRPQMDNRTIECFYSAGKFWILFITNWTFYTRNSSSMFMIIDMWQMLVKITQLRIPDHFQFVITGWIEKLKNFQAKNFFQMGKYGKRKIFFGFDRWRSSTTTSNFINFGSSKLKYIRKKTFNTRLPSNRG